MLEETFLGTVVSRACKARQPDKQGHFVQLVVCRLGREVEIEFHLAAKGGGLVGKLEQLAPKGCYGSLSRHRHLVRTNERSVLSG